MSEKTKFWLLLSLLILSIALVWWLNTSLSQDFVNKFVH
jgi:hypothetical protein